MMKNKKKDNNIDKKKDAIVLHNKRIKDCNFLFHKIFKSTIKDGKKIRVFNSFSYLIKKLKINNVRIPLFFNKIFKKLDLNLDYKTQNLGSIKYKLPYISLGNKSLSKVATWVRKSIKNRPERSFNTKLFNEFTDIILNKGNTVEKKRDFYINFFRGRPFLRFLRLYKPRTKYRFNYINMVQFRKNRKFGDHRKFAKKKY